MQRQQPTTGAKGDVLGEEPVPSTSSSSDAMADFTGSTLADREWFGSPPEGGKIDALPPTHHKLEDDDVEMAPAAHASALTAALARVLDASSEPTPAAPRALSSADSAVPTVMVTGPPGGGYHFHQDEALSALSTLPSSPALGDLSSFPAAPAPASRGGGRKGAKGSPSKKGGRKGKKGSATASSTPAHTVASTPIFAPAKPRVRCRFALAPIAFHIGPCDEVDPRSKPGNRHKQWSAPEPASDREKDRDLFLIRNRLAELNGRPCLERGGSSTRPRGSASSSRAQSVVPGEIRNNLYYVLSFAHHFTI
jgi:hypothetical protein